VLGLKELHVVNAREFERLRQAVRSHEVLPDAQDVDQQAASDLRAMHGRVPTLRQAAVVVAVEVGKHVDTTLFGHRLVEGVD